MSEDRGGTEQHPDEVRPDSEPVDDPPVGAEADQTASDSDQTVSDADQTASDADQAGADRNQAQADADQDASDRDQAASDRDLEAHDPSDAAFLEVHDLSREERQQGTSERGATGSARRKATLVRVRTAARRDEAARMRDLVAEARDLAAEARDQAAEAYEQALGTGNPDAASTRAGGAEDRALAAEDRARAAADRARAAGDREQALSDLQRADHDDLTGFYRRGAGSDVLRNEIDRAQRSEGRLVLAFIDVDGLKDVNDQDGHAAGDDLLLHLAATLRSNLGSHDPVVRFGGDEFVCAVLESDLEEAQRRFDGIRTALASQPGGASIGVGLAALQAGDSLETLLARSDAALHEDRHRA